MVVVGFARGSCRILVPLPLLRWLWFVLEETLISFSCDPFSVGSSEVFSSYRLSIYESYPDISYFIVCCALVFICLCK